MTKPKLFAWSDFGCNTGFAKVAHNLYQDLYKDFDVHLLGINYHGLQDYDTSKYFVYPISNDDPFGYNRMGHILNKLKPDLIFLFQDIFNIIPAVNIVKKVLGSDIPIVTYYPIDGAPVNYAWKQAFTDKAINKHITYSNWAIDEIKNTFPEETKDMDIDILYHGVDEDLYYPLKKFHIKQVKREQGWQDKFVVINLNRFQPRKGIDRTIQAFAMLRYGYYIDKDGNWFPRTFTRHPLQYLTMDDIVDEIPGHDDVIMYVHAQPFERIFGPGKACSLFAQARHNGIKDDGLKKDFFIPPRDIMSNPYPEEQINELYNAADVNISAALGEGALIQGTPVYTINGWKPIEYVNNEDSVLTDDGTYKKVILTAKYENIKSYYSIRLKNTNIPIKLTGNHRLLTKDGYKEAQNLTLEDSLAYRKHKLCDGKILIPNNILDMNFSESPFYSDTCEDNLLTSGKYKSARYLTIDKDFGKLVGLYCAEGHIASERSVGFSLHKDENELYEFITDWFEENINIYGTYDKPHFIPSKKDKSGVIYLHNKHLAKTLEYICGKGSRTKTLTPEIYHCSKGFLEGFLEGYVAGDGYIINNGKKMRTASHSLAQDIKMLVASLHNTLIQVNKYPNNGYSCGETDIYEMTWYDKNGNYNWNTKLLETDENFIYVPIKSIEENLNENNKFYDLQVPGQESYMIHNCMSHNCGLSLIEASSTGTTSIAPHNSAIPEMIGDTGHLCKNIGTYIQALDNSHMRPLVDIRELVKALEIEYTKWIKNDRKKVFNQACVDRCDKLFRWPDKREKLRKILLEHVK